jgi:hypothetical protein
LHAGKLGRQGCLKAIVPGSLVHIVDQLSHRPFLVDTGASYSIFPHHSSTVPIRAKLQGGAVQLMCWGEKIIILSFHGRRYSWTFVLAAVSFSIIGVDFLHHFKLMVDPAANAQVDKCSAKSFATVSTMTAAASADNGCRWPLSSQPAVTGQISPVNNHRSSPASL